MLMGYGVCGSGRWSLLSASPAGLRNAPCRAKAQRRALLVASLFVVVTAVSCGSTRVGPLPSPGKNDDFRIKVEFGYLGATDISEGWSLRSPHLGLMVDAVRRRCGLSSTAPGPLCTDSATIAFAVRRSFHLQSTAVVYPPLDRYDAKNEAISAAVSTAEVSLRTTGRVRVRWLDAASSWHWMDERTGVRCEVAHHSITKQAQIDQTLKIDVGGLGSEIVALHIVSAEPFELRSIRYPEPVFDDLGRLGCGGGGTKVGLITYVPVLGMAVVDPSVALTWSSKEQRQPTFRAVEVDAGICRCNVVANLVLSDGSTQRCRVLGVNGYVGSKPIKGLVCDTPGSDARSNVAVVALVNIVSSTAVSLTDDGGRCSRLDEFNGRTMGGAVDGY